MFPPRKTAIYTADEALKTGDIVTLVILPVEGEDCAVTMVARLWHAGDGVPNGVSCGNYARGQQATIGVHGVFPVQVDRETYDTWGKLDRMNKGE